MSKIFKIIISIFFIFGFVKVYAISPDFKIISRSEWGADETLRYADSEYWSSSSDGGSSTESASAKAAREKRQAIDTYLVNNFPEDYITTQVITTENGHELVWPITKTANIKGIIVHHTATEAKDSYESIRSIYKYHTLSNRRGDIGYNYLIGINGEIFEGRAGGDYVVGAHALRNNYATVGISVIGNYQDNYINSAQYESLKKLIIYLGEKYGIDFASYTTYHKNCSRASCSFYINDVVGDTIVGHRDAGNTDCPGDAFYNQLQVLKSEVQIDQRQKKSSGNTNSSSNTSNSTTSSNSTYIKTTIYNEPTYTNTSDNSNIQIIGNSEKSDIIFITTDLSEKKETKNNNNVQIIGTTSSDSNSNSSSKSTTNKNTNEIIFITSNFEEKKDTKTQNNNIIITGINPTSSEETKSESKNSNIEITPIENKQNIIIIPANNSEINSENIDNTILEKIGNLSENELLQLLALIDYKISKNDYRIDKLNYIRKNVLDFLNKNYLNKIGKGNSNFDDTNFIKIKLSYPHSDSIKISKEGQIYDVEVQDGQVKANGQLHNYFTVFGDNVEYLEITSWNRVPDWDKEGKYNDNKFRGNIILYVKDGKLVVVNEVKLSDYLKGLGEVSNDGDYEKIKTIIIAARSYARRYITEARKFPGELYDGSDDPDVFQKYLGYGLEMRSPNINSIVDKTANQVITYDGKLIKSWYFSQSSGKTMSYVEYCQKNNNITCKDSEYPFLVGVFDPGSVGKSPSGHGVGISGAGSTFLASKGWTSEMIIKYFLNGVKIQEL